MAKSTPYLIPYLKSGLSSYPYGFYAGSVPSQIGYWERKDKRWPERYDWKENKVFTASLKIVRMESNRQNRILLKNNDESGATYSMTMANVVKLLTKGTIVYGDVYGKWKFAKNGDSYTLVPVF